MSTRQIQRHPLTLLSNTVQNPKSNCHFIAITTWCGITTVDSPFPAVEIPRDYKAAINESPILVLENATDGEGKAGKDKYTREVSDLVI